MARKWVNARFDFDECSKLVRFSLPRCHSLAILEAIDKEDAESLAEILRTIIVQARPELTGLSLMSVGFAPEYGCFEAIAFHPSLSPVALGCTIPRQLLEQEGETWRTREPML